MNTQRTALIYTDGYLAYHLRDDHPLQQRRLKMAFRLMQACGLIAPNGPVDWIEPQPATKEQIRRAHTPDYVETVKQGLAGARTGDLRRYGLGPGDTPAFEGMYDAAALISGGTVEAARLVLRGEYDIAFNLGGGVNHHAHPDHASGFGIFNDLAVGIHELLENGVSRVAYIDIDVHHGDGVQACFYDDPRVMTISLHESGRYLYPGTGFPNEIGSGAARGTSINLPFLPHTGDAVWHDGFDAVVPAALERFQPEAVMLQLGADAHWEDPLAHLLLTSQGWMKTVEKLLVLSAGKPLVVTGGGGYNLRTVARLWTLVTALCAGVELPNAVPVDIAAEYGIPALHDTDTPEIAAEGQEKARQYREDQVARLRELGVL
jgi:acetoin utilization protein AcuC